VTDRDQQIADAVRRYWGFSALRPLQADAIQAALAHRDSLVVLPTGGGKSLCYQVPPLVAARTDFVVSPLISLMKDQVDGLRASGYAAAGLHSGMTLDELRGRACWTCGRPRSIRSLRGSHCTRPFWTTCSRTPLSARRRRRWSSPA